MNSSRGAMRSVVFYDDTSQKMLFIFDCFSIILLKINNRKGARQWTTFWVKRGV